MGDQDQPFQNRWEFRRTGNDFDSSSEEDHSRPISSIEPKVMKQKLVTCLTSDENAEQNMHNPTPLARGQKEKEPNSEKSNKKPKKTGKANERKAGSRKTKKANFKDEPSNAAMRDLRGFMESLVEKIKGTREDLLAWMNDELNFSSKGDDITTPNPKPSGTKRGKTQNTKSRKSSTDNPSTSKRKKAAKVTQNFVDGSPGRRSPKTNGEVVVPPKVGENIVIAIPAEMTEKQKAKNAKSPSKKQKVAGTTADKNTDKGFGKASTAAADNSTRCTAMVSLKQGENSERNTLDTEDERSALNSAVNVSSHQLNFDPRSQQKDKLFSQNGPSNANDYKNNAGPSICNVNGNMFPFSFASQGLNNGVVMRNFPSQFGLQYLAQGNRMPGVYREPPMYPNTNQAFLESLGAFNQHLKFNAQQGGATGLQYPDIRRGAYNQGNIPDQ